MSKPKYKYIIYSLIKHFNRGYYDYVKIDYLDTEDIITLTLRKTLYMCEYTHVTKKYLITKDMYNHIKINKIICSIENNFNKLIRSAEV